MSVKYILKQDLTYTSRERSMNYIQINIYKRVLIAALGGKPWAGGGGGVSPDDSSRERFQPARQMIHTYSQFSRFVDSTGVNLQTF